MRYVQDLPWHAVCAHSYTPTPQPLALIPNRIP